MSRKVVHRKWVAWLAIVAMWLTIVVPVVSRTLPAATIGPDLEFWCTGHGLDHQHPGAPSDPSTQTDRCGYCGLVGHSPLLLTATHAVLPSLSFPALAPVSSMLRVGPHARLISANPRGPPVRD